MTGRPDRGNFVSEWFGYRTYPRVGGGDAALRIQERGRCSFLSAATHGENAVAVPFCPRPRTANGIV